MSLKRYLVFMAIATAICYLMLLLVLFYFDPFQAGIVAVIFFYISLGLSLIGTLSILGLVIRLYATKDKLVFKKVVNSFRQSILFAILILAALFLSSNQLLTWWNLVLLVLAVSVIELYFLSHKVKSAP